MERVDENNRMSLVTIWAGLGLAGLFELLTVLATQNHTVRTVSPWQKDPYDVVVSQTQFAVPMLALVIALRLLVWRAPGGPDRAHQTVRAAGAMTTLIGATLATEWAAVIVGAQASSWNGWTSALIAGLVGDSAGTLVVAALLARYRRPGGSSRRWRHDWLGDVVRVCNRIPLVRRWAGPGVVAWVRRRAMTVFVSLSVLAGVALAGSMAIGEGWTSPLLITWASIALSSSNLAFCVLSNAVGGFIARPPRSRPRRIVEASVVAGCVGTHVAIAFRDQVWNALTAAPLTTVPSLVTFTLGTGLAIAVVTAALLFAYTSRRNPPGQATMPAGALPHPR